MRVRSLLLALAVGGLATPARAEPTTLGLRLLGAPAVAAFAPSHRALVTLPAHLDPRAFGLVPMVHPLGRTTYFDGHLHWYRFG